MIYILLPVHNRREITRQFIKSLTQQSFLDYHLVLIDDGSVDGTANMARLEIDKLTVITGKGNWWWAGSLQKGINWLKKNDVAENDIVVFMNDDVTFDVHFLQTAIELLEERDDLLLPYVFNQNTGKIEESGVYADLKKLTFVTADSPEDINCLPTRGLFMKMSTLRKVGGFYPKLLPHYLSDYEFTIRAHKCGFKLLTSSKLVVYFDGVPSGIHGYDQLSIIKFIKQIFSIRSRLNPVYWTTFIVLCSPPLFIPWLIVRVWLLPIKLIFLQIMSGDNNKSGSS